MPSTDVWVPCAAAKPGSKLEPSIATTIYSRYDKKRLKKRLTYLFFNEAPKKDMLVIAQPLEFNGFPVVRFGVPPELLGGHGGREGTADLGRCLKLSPSEIPLQPVRLRLGEVPFNTTSSPPRPLRGFSHALTLEASTETLWPVGVV